MSEAEGSEETEREHEKLGLQEGRKAGSLRRGHSGYWRGRRGCGGRSALVRLVSRRVLVRLVSKVMLVETWTSKLGFKPGLLGCIHSRETQTH